MSLPDLSIVKTLRRDPPARSREAAKEGGWKGLDRRLISQNPVSPFSQLKGECPAASDLIFSLPIHKQRFVDKPV